MTTPAPAAPRDFVEEYIRARMAVRAPKITITTRGDRISRAMRIAVAAEKAGVRLDELALDEIARQRVYGDAK